MVWEVCVGFVSSVCVISGNAGNDTTLAQLAAAAAAAAAAWSAATAVAVAMAAAAAAITATSGVSARMLLKHVCSPACAHACSAQWSQSVNSCYHIRCAGFRRALLQDFAVTTRFIMQLWTAHKLTHEACKRELVRSRGHGLQSCHALVEFTQSKEKSYAADLHISCALTCGASRAIRW
jgi:hypothetical protein